MNPRGKNPLSLASMVSLFLAFLLILSMTSCQGKGGRILGATLTGNGATAVKTTEVLRSSDIVGRVLNMESGEAIAGAKVKVVSVLDPSVLAEGTTDGTGLFSLTLGGEGTASISVEKEGFAPQAQVLQLSPGANTVQMRAQPVTFMQETVIDADTKSLAVKVPGNSLSIEITDPSKALGATGPIRAEITVGDPRQDRDAFPGGFMAVSAGLRGGLRAGSKRAVVRKAGEPIGEVVELASIMFGNITLRDSEGNIISSLKQPAKVRMKIPTGSMNPATSVPFKVGDTVPTYYVDETLGTWVPELDDGGQQVLGTVVQGDDGLYSEFMARHFSWWNLDQPISTRSCVRGRVIDPCGQPKKDIRVCGNGVTFNGATCNGVLGTAALQFGGGVDKKEEPTGENGKFCLDALKGSTISVETGVGGQWGWFNFSFTETFTKQNVTMSNTVGTCADAGAACQDLGDVSITPTLRKVSGKVVGAGAVPVPGAVVSLGKRLAKADANGLFSVETEPGDDLLLSITHPEGALRGRKENKISVPGVSPSPGQCDALAAVDLGTVALDTETGCARGKLLDEAGRPISGATVSIGGSTIQSDEGGNYCLASLEGDQDLKLTYYDKGRGRMHNKKSGVQIVGGGQCGGESDRCVHADIEVELGDACISGRVTNQKGAGVAGATVRAGSTMVTTGPDGAYCLMAPVKQKVKVTLKHASGGQGTSGSESEDEVDVETGSAGMCGGGCTIVNRTLTINEPPVVSKLESSKKVAQPGDEVVVTATASDAEGDPLQFLWTSTDGDLSKITSSGGRRAPSSLKGPDPAVAWKAPSSSGKYTVSVRVEDNRKGTGMASVDIEVAVDADGDKSPAGTDCNDSNPAVYPGATESCDGVDNNCNGSVDEGIGGSSCASTSLGVCAAGTMKCTAGILACASILAPGAEICDGLDNNCNGRVDENTGGTLCATGRSGLCAGGTQQCRSGSLVCVQTLAQTSEVCGDGIDNDCNGRIDEVCQCSDGSSQSCYSGAASTRNVGSCKAGTQTCAGGIWGNCTGEVLPALETCDGKDNDCDAAVDNGLGAASCTSTQAGVCSAGTQQCTAGSLACASSLAPSADICDNLDNDCDGSTDEEFTNKGQACSAGQGACQSTGTFSCKADGTGTECSAIPGAPATEICDGMDNDCDGSTDEGGICAPAAPSNLMAVIVSSSRINLSWADNASNEAGFVVEQKIGGGAFAALATVGPNIMSYSSMGLSGGTTYTYRVAAFLGADNSAYSNEAGGTTPAGFVQKRLDGGWSQTCAIMADTTVRCWGGAFGGVPVQVSGLVGVENVGSGASNNCAVLSDGSVKCWTNSGSPATISGLTGAKAVDGGASHQCAVLADSTVRCWGSNYDGQLGDGTTVNSTTPVSVVGLMGVVTLSTDESSNCALMADATVKCWGDNGMGQLGDGSSVTLSNLPVAVVGISTAVGVSAEGFHACAALADGAVKCWGSGYGTTPVVVSGISSAVAVLAEDSHSCALLSDSTVKCWGSNSNGQLGNGSTVASSTPVAVIGLTGVVELSGGDSFVCARLQDGSVKCWGDNTSGQTGSGSLPNYKIPVTVGVASDWTTAQASYYHSCARRATGTAWCWGINLYGQFGDGTTSSRAAPVQLGSNTDWLAISTGTLHTCAVKSTGTLWCWGLNGYGQLGNGSVTQQLTPVQVGTATNWTAVTTGSGYTCGIRSPGSLWCWGVNAYGQLGDGSVTQRLTPVQVGTATNWTSATAGSTHTCGVQSPGILSCWGINAYGQLGDGTTIQKLTPVQVGPATNWTSVTTGYTHTCGVQSPGILSCWGQNGSGQLGDGTTTQRFTPTQVGTATSWTSITTGPSHTCGIQSPGSLSCWGINSYGQLGDGTITQKLAPTQVGTATNWTSITVGSIHSCGVQSPGTLSCWGSNNSGLIGDGMAWKDTPVQVLLP
ncbi:MAG: carboxypeptidase regulatory-like domain-containing protein [Nitrospirae bacterium]|nr:carboxypeptidase regulatory-like domain-containing protein [Nitrospirota bacterium]